MSRNKLIPTVVFTLLCSSSASLTICTRSVTLFFSPLLQLCFTSLPIVGASVGSLSTGYLLVLGKRKLLILALSLGLIGWLGLLDAERHQWDLIMSPNGPLRILTCRFLTGLSTGLLIPTCLMLLVEKSELPNNSVICACLVHLGLVSGGLVTYSCVLPSGSWSRIALLGSVVSFALLVTTLLTECCRRFLVSDSPKCSIERVQVTLHGSGRSNNDSHLASRSSPTDQSASSSAPSTTWFPPNTRLALYLALLRQVIGCEGVIQYVNQVVVLSRQTHQCSASYVWTTTGLILYGPQVTALLLLITLAHFSSRTGNKRKLLTVSLFLMALAYFAMGFIFWLQPRVELLSSSLIKTSTGLLMFAFALGWSALPTAVTIDAFKGSSSHQCGQAVGLSWAVVWLIGPLIALLFDQILLQLIPTSSVYYLFGGICLIVKFGLDRLALNHPNAIDLLSN